MAGAGQVEHDHGAHGGDDDAGHDHGRGGQDHAGHGHGPGGHHHAISPDADRRWLLVAFGLIAGFMGVELVVGLLADSLALLSDAAHMLTDAGSILLALVAARLAVRPPGGAFTFGFARSEILSAQLNGAALLVLAGIIAVEAIGRLFDPLQVEGLAVVVVGAIGALVNVAAAVALSKAERRSLNVQGARAHVMTDLWASIATVIAGALIAITDVREIDGVVSLLVCALMLRSGWTLLSASSRVLLEASPRGLSPQEVGQAMASSPGVVEVHDLHVWEVTSGFPSLAAHVLVPEGQSCHLRREELTAMLHDRFGIDHVTLQVEHAHGPQLLRISGRP